MGRWKLILGGGVVAATWGFCLYALVRLFTEGLVPRRHGAGWVSVDDAPLTGLVLLVGGPIWVVGAPILLWFAWEGERRAEAYLRAKGRQAPLDVARRQTRNGETVG